MALEACLMVYRHDLLGIEAPNFKEAKGKERDCSVDRPWYKDKWFTHLKTGLQDSDSDFCLRSSFTVTSLYQNWERTFKSIGIGSMHVAHIPRVVQTFILGLQG